MSVIHLAKIPVYHARTKHIQAQYHFIRSTLEDEILTLEKKQGSRNPDILTKTDSRETEVVCNFSWTSSLRT